MYRYLQLAALFFLRFGYDSYTLARAFSNFSMSTTDVPVCSFLVTYYDIIADSKIKNVITAYQVTESGLFLQRLLRHGETLLINYYQ